MGALQIVPLYVSPAEREAKTLQSMVPLFQVMVASELALSGSLSDVDATLGCPMLLVEYVCCTCASAPVVR